jgi:hypothetical protein
VKNVFLALLIIFAFLGKVFADDGDHTDTLPVSAPADSFYAAIENYFKVSEDQIKACQQQNIAEEEIPVVFFIAQRGSVDPNAVLTVRSEGLNWMQTAYHFHLNPRIFFEPLPANVLARTPYEKSYGYYKGHSSRINLSDADITNWVNLKFLTEHYGYDPQEIIQMRSAGKSFRDINTYYANKKEAVGWDVDQPQEEAQSTPDSKEVDKQLEQFGKNGMPGSGVPGGMP